MPQVYRLTSAEHRSWSANMPQLVNEKGVPQMPLTPALEDACHKAISQARRSEKGLKTTVTIEEPSQLPNTPPVRKKVAIEVKVKRLGRERGEIQTFCFVEGMLRVSTREIMTARFFKRFGECQLLRPNGKFMKVIRDPSNKVSNVAHVNTTQYAPAPENCQCKEWGGRELGKHHPICQYNEFAPADQRGRKPGDDSLGNPIRKPNLPAGVNPQGAGIGVPIQGAVAKEEVIPEPSECACKDWNGTPKGKHHPICQWHEKWLIKFKASEARWLVSLDTGKKVRVATSDEVAQAEIEERKTGSPILAIQDALYAVLTEEQVKKGEGAVYGSAVEEDDEPAPETSRGEKLEEDDSLPFARPDDTTEDGEEAAFEAPQPKEEVGINGSPEEKEEGLPLPGLGA